jgi:WD40 repeat protein
MILPQDYVLSVGITPDGQWVVSGSKDRGIQFWNINSDQAQLMLQGHRNSGELAEHHIATRSSFNPCVFRSHLN